MMWEKTILLKAKKLLEVCFIERKLTSTSERFSGKANVSIMTGCKL